MKTLLILIITIFSFGSGISAQPIDSSNVVDRYFGFSLQPNFQGLINYAIIEVNKKGLANRVYLSRRDWLHQLVGIQKSTANPEEKNLLKEAGLEGPDVINELWKLRYSETPYGGQTVEKGWAGKPTIPTEGQMDMLRQFGIKTINDYFYGENLFKLLKAMEDPGWVSEYQNK